MQHLIQFLFRNSAFFVFMFLEIVSIVLIVRSNEKQRAIYLHSSNQLVGHIYEEYDALVDYFSLADQADSLALENALLKTRLFNNPGRRNLHTTAEDTLDGENYRIIPATVINNSITSRNNSMTLDKGSKAGIRAGMGVISAHGPVGIVQTVSPSFSRVISLLHSDARISASIRRNNYFGSLVWRGFNPKKMYLEAIPKHAELRTGDTIQTSGYSMTFPEGIMIGVIDTFRISGGSNFYTVGVALEPDLSNLDHVYVVDYLKKKEQATLENGRDE